MDRLELSFREELVMSILWEGGKDGMSCAEVLEQLQKRYGLTYRDTTVYTFLKNLVEKKYVSKKRVRVTMYIPNMEKSKESYIDQKVGELIDIWFDGDREKLLKYLEE